MKNDSKLFETLRTDGLIGKELYKIVTDDYEDSIVGIIAGAALCASYEAYENAKKTNLTLVMKEGDFLYEIKSDGSKKIIKSIPKNIEQISNKFTLK